MDEIIRNEESFLLAKARSVLEDRLNFRLEPDKDISLSFRGTDYKASYGNVNVFLYPLTDEAAVLRYNKDSSGSSALGLNSYPDEHFIKQGIISEDDDKLGWYATVRNPRR